MGWCGSTVAEETGGPIRDSGSSEGSNRDRALQAIPDFGEAGVEAGVAASRLRRQGFSTLPSFAAEGETEVCLDAQHCCGRSEQLGPELIEQDFRTLNPEPGLRSSGEPRGFQSSFRLGGGQIGVLRNSLRDEIELEESATEPAATTETAPGPWRSEGRWTLEE